MSLSSRVPVLSVWTRTPLPLPSWMWLRRSGGVAAGLDLHPGECVVGDVVVHQGARTVGVDVDTASLAVVDVVVAEGGVAAGFDFHAGECVVGDVVVFEGACAVGVDEDAASLAVVDVVAAEGGVAAGLDLHAGEGVVGDVVVLEGAQTVVEDVDAALPAAVDVVAAKPWVGAVTDRHARESLAADVAAFQFQPSLADVHPEPIAAGLAQGQVRDPAYVGLEPHHVRIVGTDLDVGHRAVAKDLQGLVDHQRLVVQPRSHQDAVPGVRRVDRLADRGEVPPVKGVHHMGRRLVLDRVPDGAPRLLRRAGHRARHLPGAPSGTRGDGGGRVPERVPHPRRQLRDGLAHQRRGERLEP